MRRDAIMLCCLALAGCGHAGAAVPARVAGAWGADCTAPFVTFAGGSVHVGPDMADYPLKSAVLSGQDLAIAYDSGAGPVTEHYLIEGDTLRLVSGTYAGQDATWHKAPMRRCGA